MLLQRRRHCFVVVAVVCVDVDVAFVASSTSSLLFFLPPCCGRRDHRHHDHDHRRHHRRHHHDHRRRRVVIVATIIAATLSPSSSSLWFPCHRRNHRCCCRRNHRCCRHRCGYLAVFVAVVASRPSLLWSSSKRKSTISILVAAVGSSRRRHRFVVLWLLQYFYFPPRSRFTSFPLFLCSIFDSFCFLFFSQRLLHCCRLSLSLSCFFSSFLLFRCLFIWSACFSPVVAFPFGVPFDVASISFFFPLVILFLPSFILCVISISNIIVIVLFCASCLYFSASSLLSCFLFQH